MAETSDGAGWLKPTPPQSLEGREPFAGLDATVADFWRWAFSDLRENTTRGILGEFLVARAVGDQRPIRNGWDNFDVVGPDGTTIEVKCSAFLQSWSQRKHSSLSFGRLRGREFDAERNEYSVEARVRAEVFVFAVQTQLEPEAYDMLDLCHWEFWVVDGQTVRTRAGKTVGIGWVRQHAVGPVPYEDLAAAVDAARRHNAVAEVEQRPDHSTGIQDLYAEQHTFAVARDADVVPRLFVERALESEIFLVGQALGRDTQRLSGVPYVFPGGPPHALSRGGHVLDRWLADVGYTISPDVADRRYAYHADLHPGFPGRKAGGGDVVPSKADVEASAAWLRGEIEVAGPRVLVALGKEPALELLRRYGGVELRALGEATDRVWRLRLGRLDLPMVAAFHPSGAFQHPDKAESAWAFASAAIGDLLGK